MERPENYQQEAVKTAQEILATRDVSDHDRQTALEELEREEMQSNKMSKSGSEFYSKTSGFLTYLFQPSEQFEARRWIYLFCIIVGGVFLWRTIPSIKVVGWLFSGNSQDNLGAVFMVLLFAYVPLMIVLMLLKNTWGWRLAFAHSVFIVMSEVGLALLNAYRSDLYLPLVQVVIHGALLRLLLRKEVIYYFRISKETRINTIRTSIIIGVFLTFFMAWIL